MSKPLDLMGLIWGATNKATGHSWVRLNVAMQDGLRLAISAGFRFERDDIKAIIAYGRGRWVGCETVERGYALAVESGNISAAIAIERYRDRKPFTAKGLAVGVNGIAREVSRLAAGFTFDWDGARATVTSFAKDGQSLTACTYKSPQKDERGYRLPAKIDRRYTITLSDLRAANQKYIDAHKSTVEATQ